MVSFETIKTVAFTAAPFVIPYVIRKYRSFKGQAQMNRPARRPVPEHVRRSLNILFVACVLAIVSTIPALSPENIFVVTSSRIQTSSNVLWERFTTLRPDHRFTELDDKLRDTLQTVDGRCLYLVYGPDILGHCPFCKTDEPNSYFYYALPSLLFPHLLNFIALGLATSIVIARKEGSRWRTQASIAGIMMAVADIALYQTYDWKANSRAVKGKDLTHFYWRMRIIRGIALAILDGGFACLLWLSSTNRLFVVPPSATERVIEVIKLIETQGGKISAAGVVQNTTVRSEALRTRCNDYWKQEGDVMQEIMAEKQVVDSMRNVLGSGRINMEKVEQEANLYSENLLSIQGLELEP